MGPSCVSPFLVWPSFTPIRIRRYRLSLPIRPFQGPLYTVIGALLPPWSPTRSGVRVWSAPAIWNTDKIAYTSAEVPCAQLRTRMDTTRQRTLHNASDPVQSTMYLPPPNTIPTPITLSVRIIITRSAPVSSAQQFAGDCCKRSSIFATPRELWNRATRYRLYYSSADFVFALTNSLAAWRVTQSERLRHRIHMQFTLDSLWRTTNDTAAD